MTCSTNICFCFIETHTDRERERLCWMLAAHTQFMNFVDFWCSYFTCVWMIILDLFVESQFSYYCARAHKLFFLPEVCESFVCTFPCVTNVFFLLLFSKIVYSLCVTWIYFTIVVSCVWCQSWEWIPPESKLKIFSSHNGNHTELMRNCLCVLSSLLL